MNMPDIRKSALCVKVDNRVMVAIDSYAASIGSNRSAVVYKCILDRFGKAAENLSEEDARRANDMDNANMDRRKSKGRKRHGKRL